MNNVDLRLTFLAAVLSLASADAYPQVTLQPWIEVYGSTNGEQLGMYVTGITPSANLPFKAAVSKVGSTGLYQLEDSTQTAPQMILIGENILTGDLNNDGYTDLVTSQSTNGWETVYVYWGTVTGIDTVNLLIIPSDAQSDGFKAACIADVNNDGCLDLVNLEPYYGTDQGKVSIHLGPTITSTPTAVIMGDSIRSGLGGAACVGDLNNDGLNDLMIRGWNQAGPQTSRYDYINIYWGVGIDSLRLELGLQLRGYSLVSAGLACFDANGDGVDDLLWTNRDTVTVPNTIYVHFGGPGFDTVPNMKLQNPGVADFGNVVVNVGDMSGDGNTEIAIAASQGTIISGFVFVFEGGARLNDQYDAAVGMSSDSEFGTSVSSVGDVSGDGLADIIIGAPAFEFGNNRGYWGIFKGDSLITSVVPSPVLPSFVRLYQCYPNPFNPQTTIRYELIASADVVLEVVDLLGKHIATLVQERKPKGNHEAIFNGTGLSSGIYLYRLTAKTPNGTLYTDTKKLTLIK